MDAGEGSPELSGQEATLSQALVSGKSQSLRKEPPVPEVSHPLPIPSMGALRVTPQVLVILRGMTWGREESHLTGWLPEGSLGKLDTLSSKLGSAPCWSHDLGR